MNSVSGPRYEIENMGSGTLRVRFSVEFQNDETMDFTSLIRFVPEMSIGEVELAAAKRAAALLEKLVPGSTAGVV